MEKSEMMKRYEAETGVSLEEAKERWKTFAFYSRYIAWLEAKAAAYDRLMSGGKKTPKEVANFLDLPIAQDKEGFWYAFGSPPVIDELRGTWGSLLGYEKEIPSFNIRYTGNWKDSLTIPDEWEERTNQEETFDYNLEQLGLK